MIKRLDLYRVTRRQAEWPDGDEPQDGHLFSPRRSLRRMVVQVDAELLAHDAPVIGQDPVEPRALLSALLQHPLVRLLRYADDGPPPTAPPKKGDGWLSDKVYDGWAVLQERTPDDGVWGVIYPTEGGYSLSGVIGNAPDIAARDEHADAYQDLDAESARDRRHADALAAQVAAQALDADLYITERPYLHRATWKIAHGVTVCTVEEAIPLVSLYLRAQNEFLVSHNYTFNRGLFYWVGTRELLPSAWRWFTACVRHSIKSQDDSLQLLAGSLLQRVDRALETRDAIHIALNQPQDNDLRDDALSNLDSVLILLVAAFDVAARVAHRVLAIPANEHRAGWQYARPGDWLDLVRVQQPSLAAIVDSGSDGGETLTIIRRLRNSVHGAALQGMAFVRDSNPQESLVALPSEDEAGLLAAMQSLGGHAEWGVKNVLPDRIHVDPGTLVDRIFDRAIPLLNALLTETPVEVLPHADLTAADSLPPAARDPKGFGDPFDPWARQSIRMQLGL